MKLFLHIGTEKTGSSYLQTLLALNRKQLESNHIYYPSAGDREDDMIEGRISPGNGKDLFLALRSLKRTEVKTLLSNYKKKASQKHCKNILLSNENLIEVLASYDKFALLHEICNALGIVLTDMLLILRDPLEQALSLFKHRAKNGSIPDIESWVQTKYLLPEFLDKFLIIADTYSLNLSVRKYVKDSDTMKKIVFCDWLKLDMPEVVFNQSVNASLTISELIILREIGKFDKKLIKPFYECMLRIPLKEKESDNQIVEKYKNIVSYHILEYKKIWEKCNLRLHSDEKLIIPQKQISITNEPLAINLSEIQLKEIINFFTNSQGNKGVFNAIYIKLKRRLRVILKRY